jgi:hypothetical protein
MGGMIRGWKYPILFATLLVALSPLVVSGIGVAAAPPRPAQTPQRVVSEQWVSDIGRRDQRGACELQTVQEVNGQPCTALWSRGWMSCPASGEGGKPPYRKSEIRTAAEQVGEFTEETSTRGFIRIRAQVKAKRLWGVLGLEQAEGVWRTTYLRYGNETFAPAGTSYQSEAWHKLWVSNWCPTNHPRWEKTN